MVDYNRARLNCLGQLKKITDAYMKRNIYEASVQDIYVQIALEFGFSKRFVMSVIDLKIQTEGWRLKDNTTILVFGNPQEGVSVSE